MEVLKVELKNIKEKLRTTENTNNDLNDKGMAPLSKKGKNNSRRKQIVVGESKVA